MDAVTALQTFLAGALAWKHERYIGFVAKPKTQTKFLREIYHGLDSDLDDAKAIPKLPASRGPLAGYRYAPPDEFGTPVADIRKECDSIDDSVLIVSSDGRFGIYTPESDCDGRRIFRV
ncbi:MAG: hypothetical protein AAF495_29380 [Pseudomonadota bacterium]